MVGGVDAGFAFEADIGDPSLKYIVRQYFFNRFNNTDTNTVPRVSFMSYKYDYLLF